MQVKVFKAEDSTEPLCFGDCSHTGNGVYAVEFFLGAYQVSERSPIMISVTLHETNMAGTPFMAKLLSADDERQLCDALAKAETEARMTRKERQVAELQPKFSDAGSKEAAVLEQKKIEVAGSEEDEEEGDDNTKLAAVAAASDEAFENDDEEEETKLAQEAVAAAAAAATQEPPTLPAEEGPAPVMNTQAEEQWDAIRRGVEKVRCRRGVFANILKKIDSTDRALLFEATGDEPLEKALVAAMEEELNGFD